MTEQLVQQLGRGLQMSTRRSSSPTQQQQPQSSLSQPSGRTVEYRTSDDSDIDNDDNEEETSQRQSRGIEQAKRTYERFLKNGVAEQFRYSVVLSYSLLDNDTKLDATFLTRIMLHAAETYFARKRTLNSLYLVLKLGFLIGNERESRFAYFVPGWNTSLRSVSSRVRRNYVSRDVKTAVDAISSNDFASKMTLDFADQSDDLMLIPANVQLTVFFRASRYQQ